MRIRPILFKTDMVRAILEGRKTVTRRAIKPANPFRNKEGYFQGNGLWIDGYNKDDEPNGHIKDYSISSCWMYKEHYINTYAPYKTGDIMYVRETWRVGAWDIQNQMIAFDYKDGVCGRLTDINDRELFERLVNQSREDARKANSQYNGADFVWNKGNSPCRWRPSIHMPKEAARIWLKVKDIRVERLQDISGHEVLKEGINSHVHPKADYFNMNQREMFEKLWNSTIQESDQDLYGWNANPWVWVIRFERCEKPEGWCV